MEEYISKSEQKRRFKQTESVAAEIAELSNNDLKSFPGSDELKEEIQNIRGLKGGARQRQIKYLAKVMRQEPLDDIYNYLSERKGSHLKSKQQFHEAERIRDAIINEAIADHEHCRQEQLDWDMDWQADEIAVACKSYPSLDAGEIRKTVYSYVKSRNRLHYRELHRMVKAAIDLADVKKKTV